MHFNAQYDIILLGDEMLLETFGNKLKITRENLGISQVKLSTLTGVVREQISRIENGQINPTLETIYKLSGALETPLKDLFDFSLEDDIKIRKYKIKPFVKWAGGKTQLLDEIKDLMPKKFDTYYEPFLGGGALFFNLIPNKAVVSDYNEELMMAYNTFKNTNEYTLMIEKIIEHENNHNEEYYYKIREMDRKESFEKIPPHIKAARLIYLNKACFNGLYRVNSKGFFNVPSGKKEIVRAYNKELFDDIHEYLSNPNVTLLNGDFEETVSTAKKGDFVYFDPPYDTFENKDNFTTYTKDSFGKQEQIRLSEVFKKLDKKGVYVMLSNHNTQFINELYQGYKIRIIEARRNINSKGNGRGKVEEVIITNY